MTKSRNDISHALKIGLLVLIAIGVVWRLCRYFLQMPVWGDEAMLCLHFFDRGYAGLAHPLGNAQVSPILFLWSEFTMFKLAGGSELSLRFLPVAAGIAALFVFRRFACGSLQLDPAHRNTGLPTGGFPASESAAVLATGILAVSYYPVRHSCEIKPYAFDLLAAVILLSLAAAWLRTPRRMGPMLSLICFTPVAIGMSFPAVFVVGGISLALLPRMIRQADLRERFCFAVYNAVLGAAFFVSLHFVTAGQYEHTSRYMTVYWADAFPPAQPWEFVKWFVRSHTGNMLAYPVGGRNGGSIATFALVLIGIRELIRRRAWPFLTLLLAPFFLTFIAAALHRYPYGESARVAQHLAPALCLLMAVGLASLLFRNTHDTAGGGRRMAFACALLAAIGVGGIVRDLHKPYKTPDDDRVRKIVAEIFRHTRPEDQITVFDPRDSVPVNFQWYLRLRGPRVAWDNRIDFDRLRSSGGDVWWLSFGPRAAEAAALGTRLSETGRSYRLADHSEETLRIGPLETPLAYCAVEHWTAGK